MEDQPRGMAVTIFFSFPQSPTCSKWNLLKRSIGVPLIMPKIPVIPVKRQMERFVLVQSNQNIWDHLWRRSTLIGRTGATKICCSIFTNLAWLVSIFHLCREFNWKHPRVTNWFAKMERQISVQPRKIIFSCINPVQWRWQDFGLTVFLHVYGPWLCSCLFLKMQKSCRPIFSDRNRLLDNNPYMHVSALNCSLHSTTRRSKTSCE